MILKLLQTEKMLKEVRKQIRKMRRGGYGDYKRAESRLGSEHSRASKMSKRPRSLRSGQNFNLRSTGLINNKELLSAVGRDSMRRMSNASASRQY